MWSDCNLAVQRDLLYLLLHRSYAVDPKTTQCRRRLGCNAAKLDLWRSPFSFAQYSAYVSYCSSSSLLTTMVGNFWALFLNILPFLFIILFVVVAWQHYGTRLSAVFLPALGYFIFVLEDYSRSLDTTTHSGDGCVVPFRLALWLYKSGLCRVCLLFCTEKNKSLSLLHA